MTPPRLLAPVLLALTLGLAACGGGSSGGASTGTSAASGGASGSASGPSSGTATASDQAFCNTFASASQRFGSDNTFPTKDQTDEARKLADDIESTAPDEMKTAAKGLASYFRAVADAVDKQGSNPSPDPSVLATFAAALAEINAWAPTHCTS
jgi:hypothetical protein